MNPSSSLIINADVTLSIMRSADPATQFNTLPRLSPAVNQLYMTHRRELLQAAFEDARHLYRISAPIPFRCKPSHMISALLLECCKNPIVDDGHIRREYG